MDSDEELDGDLDVADTRYSRHERIQQALHVIRSGRISFLDFILAILDPSEPDFLTYRTRFLADSSGKFAKMLDRIHENERGRVHLLRWIEPRAVELVCEKIMSEMDDVKSALAGTIKTITPESLLSWDVNTFIGSVVDQSAPTTGQVLKTAARTERARENNTIKTGETACNVIIAQLAKERSDRTLYFAAPFTLFLFTNGVSRQTIEALHKCGLCISFTSLTTLLRSLATQSLERATHIARGPHVMCYDNINISTSIFVEQRASVPAKVQSGTFAILYEVRNGNPIHMRLSPMIARAQQASDLTFNADVRPNDDQVKSFHAQLRIHIIETLLDCCKSFHDYKRLHGHLFHHLQRRKIPKGYRTKQYPLRTSTIDESSITGNIAVINDVYINQLKMTHEQLADQAIPSINDQATNARIRGAKALRTKDVNSFTRLQILQLGFGLFHLCMNLIWALLHIHRGSINQVGSLSYFFALLDRTRLGCEHPDYHTLLSTLLQILRGIIISAWTTECGHTSLAAFALSNPSPDDLLKIADQILVNHTAADYTITSESNTDEAHRNLNLLTRDLLYVLELVDATSDGDFGRIEDILGYLAMVFRGAGSNNYCSEILHFLHNLKKIWTPEFADIMRDNMLVNLTGLEGHCMPIDLNIEHLIKFLKLFFAAKGIYASWDRLGDISVNVDLLQNVRKQVGRALGIAYHGITHITPDMAAAINKVAHKVGELELHIFKPDRDENDSIRPVINTLATGEQKLKSSTLATFNRKVRGMIAGEGFELEEDELTPASFDLSRDGEHEDSDDIA
ncbi:hypothetical protein PAXINDRAFT_20870 [Paxillus involutus ATCC 200175]|uniref:DUF6589 domain-containing protein n=1 Tax=Paxillus involutus ATCC 200175 TaxID=664439 RepID=A0A0C9TCF5_PAXIN|nr:hypothetical protein PAXINDRAFT_20870 [Paxillus involutus ATCC 200175]